MQEYGNPDPEATAAAVAPEAALFGSMDPAGFGQSLLTVAGRAAQRQPELVAALGQFWASVARIGPATAALWLGSKVEPPVPVPAGDRRFADPAWTGNPFFFAIRQTYLATSKLTADLLAAGRAIRWPTPRPSSLPDSSSTRWRRRISWPRTLRRSSGRWIPAASACWLARGTSCPTWSATAACRGKWTQARSGSARTWPRRRGKSCSGTS